MKRNNKKITTYPGNCKCPGPLQLQRKTNGLAVKTQTYKVGQVLGDKFLCDGSIFEHFNKTVDAGH